MLAAALTVLLWNSVLVMLLALGVWAAGATAWMQQRPALRHALWLIVLVKLVTPPLIPVPVLAGGESRSESRLGMNSSIPRSDSDREVFQAAQGDNETLIVRGGQLNRLPTLSSEGRQAPDVDSTPNGPMIAPAGAEQPTSQPSAFTLVQVLGVLAVLLWLSVAIVLSFRRWQRVRRLAWLIRRSPTASPRVQQIVDKLARQMGLGKVKVYSVQGKIPPMVWAGWRETSILFPKSLMLHIDEEQLKWIACHELAHCLHRDQWANSFASLATAVFWWHPATWWAQAEMRKAQELCADEAAIEICSIRRRSYMETLLQALEHLQLDQASLHSPASCLFLSSVVQSRFRALSRGALGRQNQWRTRIGLLLVFGALLCIPVQAQEASPTNTSAKADLGGAAEAESESSPSLSASGSLSNRGRRGAAESDSASSKLMASSQRPLYLHWYSPFAKGEGKPRLLISARVEASGEFDVGLAGASGNPQWIRGRISPQGDEAFRVKIDSHWRSPENYAGEAKMDEPMDPEGFLWVDGYYPTRIVLSHQPTADVFLKPVVRWRGAFEAESSPLRVVAVRPSNYANEFAMACGSSVGNWLTFNVYKQTDPESQTRRNHRLAKQAVANMLAGQLKRIDWRLDAVDKKKVVQVAQQKARFIMDLGDGNRWDEQVTLKFSLRGAPELRKFEIRDSVSPALSYLIMEFELTHPNGKRAGLISGRAPVRSAFYSRGILRSDGSWPQAFELLKSKPIDFSIEAVDTAAEKSP